MQLSRSRLHTLELFATQVKLRPPQWAALAGLYPLRTGHSDLLRLHRWRYLQPRWDYRGRIMYRLSSRELHGFERPSSSRRDTRRLSSIGECVSGPTSPDVPSRESGMHRSFPAELDSLAFGQHRRWPWARCCCLRQWCGLSQPGQGA